MSDLDFVVPPADRVEEYLAVISIGFGGRGRPDEAGTDQVAFERERTLAVLDGDRFVGGASAYSFELTLPGGAFAPAAGVAGVVVVPSHTRRGITTELMRRQLDDVAARGEAFAVLTASESNFYRRFGYGSADRLMAMTIDTRHADFDPRVADSGSVRLINPQEAASAMPAVYEQERRRRPGSLSRSPAFWDIILGDAETYIGGGEQLFVLHVGGDGSADGYARYRFRTAWRNGHADGTIELRELVGADPEVEAALWRYCLDIDLSESLETVNRPVDDPIQWRLSDPRRLATTTRDRLWVRLVDVAAALGLRRYAATGELVLEVVDPFRPAHNGRYRLIGSSDDASCRRTEDPPDLALDVAELGAAYLGGVAFTDLAAAGRVAEHQPGALARADAMFASRPAPFCSTTF